MSSARNKKYFKEPRKIRISEINYMSKSLLERLLFRISDSVWRFPFRVSEDKNNKYYSKEKYIYIFLLNFKHELLS